MRQFEIGRLIAYVKLGTTVVRNVAAIIDKRSPIPGLANFGSAMLTHVPRSHSIVCDRGSAMTLTRPSPRCSHHAEIRQAKCGSGRENAKRQRISPAQPSREPALPMRRSPHGRTAIRAAVAAAARRARQPLARGKTARKLIAFGARRCCARLGFRRTTTYKEMS